MSSSEERRVKCEVLIFDGPGICPVSRDDLVDSLNTALAFNYWVGTIDHEGLRAENWFNLCALLIFPHCTHPQAYDALNADPETTMRIRRFVVGGGSFLGICGGAYFASKTAMWNGRQWGCPNLAFWPWLSRGPYLHEGPQTHEFTLPFLIDQTSVDHDDLSPDGAPYCDLHCDGGGEFVGVGEWERSPQFTPMGLYSTNRCAGVQCTVGAGTAVLWHARLERSFRKRDVEGGFRRSYSTRHYDPEVCLDECL